jgi:penicillin-binding protein 1C
MEMIYPRDNLAIFIPLEMDGKRGEAIFEVAHRRSNATIFWHIDEHYIGETTEIHKMAISPAPGHHTLTLVDDQGNTLHRVFEVVGR